MSPVEPIFVELLFIVLAPFVISLLLALPFTKRLLTKDVQTWGIPAVLLVSFLLLLRRLPTVQEGAVATAMLPWIADLGLGINFYLDGLSLLFGLVVSGIGTVIFFYTGFYFEDEAKQTRFNMWLTAFTGAMLGLVLSGNLILTFIMWELTSVTSFMLIGYYGKENQEARYSARRALVITGVGGLALIAGFLLLGGVIGQLATGPTETAEGETAGIVATVPDVETGTVETEDDVTVSATYTPEQAETTSFSFNYADMLSLDTITDHPWYVAIALLMMLAAFTKSAQFPFHFWLPGAMTAPTPASAFLHSATMVKAGIYLLARMHPIMYDSALWLGGLLGVGLLTMLISAVFALKQRDLKGLLAYSTTSWLGVLVALIAIPDFDGFEALGIGILAHALYKSALFMSAGSIDHSTHTRNIDKLGGMWKHMPATGVVVIISALSMAGAPLFLGFVAKEVLLHASTHYMHETFLGIGSTVIIVVSAGLTGTAAYIFIWDVFFAKEKEEIHYHAMPRLAVAGPLFLALAGTTLLPFLLGPVVTPLIAPVTTHEFELHLLPVGGFANTEFQLSLLALVGGLAVFFTRGFVTRQSWQYLPFTGAQAYRAVIGGVDWTGDQLVKTQNGRIRNYLMVILGVTGLIFLITDFQQNLLGSAVQAIVLDSFNTADILNVMLLVVAISAGVVSIVTKRHLIAALAVGVVGYSIAGIYVVQAAPDVALVQFLVETLATVLIIVMISRISHTQRKKVADELWNVSRVGIARDIAISALVGFSVFVFALTAVVNRPARTSISEWYIENTEEIVGIGDIVAAVVTDFRGMDTLIEITVFSMASLGVLTLLAVNRRNEGIEEDTPDLIPDPVAEDSQYLPTGTAFTQVLAYIVFPIALMVSVVHLLFGGEGPGDGFTAGVVAGLVVALGYIVFGYNEIRKRLIWRTPVEFVIAGLSVAFVNAFAPMLFGGTWLQHWELYDFSFGGLHISSTLFFEIAIGLAVFGAVSAILESIAYPGDVEVLEGDELYDPDYGLPPEERQLNPTEQGAD